jgi:hypothetical protein
MSELPIVRSTRAKVYRKDQIVTTDGRQHSVTIVDDDDSGAEGHPSGTGQKRKVGVATNTSAATIKKRKVNGEAEPLVRRTAGKPMEKLGVSVEWTRMDDAEANVFTPYISVIDFHVYGNAINCSDDRWNQSVLLCSSH